MILCLSRHPDSTHIYRTKRNDCKGFHLKPLRSTICHALQQTTVIGLLSRGSQVRALRGAPRCFATWPLPTVSSSCRASLRESRASASPAGRATHYVAGCARQSVAHLSTRCARRPGGRALLALSVVEGPGAHVCGFVHKSADLESVSRDHRPSGAVILSVAPGVASEA